MGLDYSYRLYFRDDQASAALTAISDWSEPTNFPEDGSHTVRFVNGEEATLQDPPGDPGEAMIARNELLGSW